MKEVLFVSDSATRVGMINPQLVTHIMESVFHGNHGYMRECVNVSFVGGATASLAYKTVKEYLAAVA
jgi:hypothetical protein